MSAPHRYDEHDHEHNRRLIEGQNAEIADLSRKLRLSLRAMITAGILFLIATVVVVVQIVSYIDDLEQERQDRAASVAQIIKSACDTNNEQDRILASLIEVSIRQSGFGGNIDPDQLTPFQLQVVTAIIRVQALQDAGPPSQFQQVFQSSLNELRDLTPCQQQVANYLSGTPQPPNQ